MGRSALAGFAGFTTACTLLFGAMLFLKSERHGSPVPGGLNQTRHDPSEDFSSVAPETSPLLPGAPISRLRSHADIESSNPRRGSGPSNIRLAASTSYFATAALESLTVDEKKSGAEIILVAGFSQPAADGDYLHIVREVDDGQYEPVAGFPLQLTKDALGPVSVSVPDWGKYTAWIESNDKPNTNPPSTSDKPNGVHKADVYADSGDHHSATTTGDSSLHLEPWQRIEFSDLLIGGHKIVVPPDNKSDKFPTKNYSSLGVQLAIKLPPETFPGSAALTIEHPGRPKESQPLSGGVATLNPAFSITRVGEYVVTASAAIPTANGRLEITRSFSINVAAETKPDRPVFTAVQTKLGDVTIEGSQHAGLVNGQVRFLESTQRWLPRDSDFKLKAKSTSGQPLRLVVEKNGSNVDIGEAAPPTEDGSVEMTITPAVLYGQQLGPGEHTLRIANDFTREVSSPIPIVIPQELGPGSPAISGYALNNSSTMAPLPSGAITMVSPYLKVGGTVRAGASSVLVVCRKKSQETAFVMERELPLAIAADGTFVVELTFPDGEQPERCFFVVSRHESTHAYSLPLKTAELKNPSSPLPSSVIQSIVAKDGKDEFGNNSGPYIANTSATVTVTFNGAANGDLLVITPKSGEEIKKLLEGSSAEIALSGMQEGPNEFEFYVVRGNVASEKTSFIIQSVTKGPAVRKVVPELFKPSIGDNFITIYFEGKQLDQAAAETRSNYLLHGQTQPGSYIHPDEAIFDIAGNSVRLRFEEKAGGLQRIADVYELYINSREALSGRFSAAAANEQGTKKYGIRDVLGNLLAGTPGHNGTDAKIVLNGGPAAEQENTSTTSGGFALRSREALPLVTVDPPDIKNRPEAGLPETTGKPVDYPEYTPRRPSQNGFNASDKVVSRVARLYYFRDAHRVVQIINRRAKSYNAHSSTMSRQLADQARLFAEQTTDRKNAAERQAVESAGYARQAETAIRGYERELSNARQDIERTQAAKDRQQTLISELERQALSEASGASGSDSVTGQTASQKLAAARLELEQLDELLSRAKDNETLARERISATNAAVESLREREIQDRETMAREEAQELRAVDQQFRLEVIAAEEDPDTYAAGVPGSEDPVVQVTLSVIGEGLIQMRGPTKGVNIVHTMINQIDAPVGQVRVGVHTVQVNGEDGDRMEETVGRIQRYTDHSRFLTSQSAQMLRNAVAVVASRKAQQCGLICDPCHGTPVCDPETGELIIEGGRDAGLVMPGDMDPAGRYQDAFFGREFMNELRAMDSEFTHQGNKLLSLHSMNTTSLASALFLLALASNDTRMEILGEFQGQTMYQLPVDEFEYFDASDMKRWYHFRKFKFMADNARFVSLRGYFDAQIVGDQTISPVQQEFIKLAQILKSRLITEIELKQRVVERALIEERIGDYDQQLKLAAKFEQDAQEKLVKATGNLQSQATNTILLLAEIRSRYGALYQQLNQDMRRQLDITFRSLSDFTITVAAGDKAFIDNLKALIRTAHFGPRSLMRAAVMTKETSSGRLRQVSSTTLEVSEDLSNGMRGADKDSNTRAELSSTLTEKQKSFYDSPETKQIVRLAVDEALKHLREQDPVAFKKSIYRAKHRVNIAFVNQILEDEPELSSAFAEELRKLERQEQDATPVVTQFTLELGVNEKVEIELDQNGKSRIVGAYLGANAQTLSIQVGNGIAAKWLYSKIAEIKESDLWSRLPESRRFEVARKFTSAINHVSGSGENGDFVAALFDLNEGLNTTQKILEEELGQDRARIVGGFEAVTAALRRAAIAMAEADYARSAEAVEAAHLAWAETLRVLRLSSVTAGADVPVVSERPTAKLVTQVSYSSSTNSSTSASNSSGSSNQPLLTAEDMEKVEEVNGAFSGLLRAEIEYRIAAAGAEKARRPLDHKKFLDMLIDETEEKFIELVEGTRAHTAVIDDYVKRICTALEDDFNTQFYEPAFRRIREETYDCRQVSLGQIEHTTVLTNNREFAKVSPQATMEFDLPRRRIMIAEAMESAQAAYNDYGALLNDPTFLALTKLHSGQPTAAIYGNGGPGSSVRDVLPGLPSQSGESAVIQAETGQPQFQSQLEALIPDPAIYKFETGTGYEIRPVIQPDGQSVVFNFNYMYTTNVREPVRADEKHLGRVKRHFIDTDVQIGNYEMREVSRYRVALKASRTGRGVPFLEDVPLAGALFRPLPSAESSLQQNVILAQSIIYPTMFDLMGLRWAPSVADLDTNDLQLQEFTYRNRMRMLKNEVYDYSSAQVDEFLRIPQGERRADLYRTQVPIPMEHPNGYIGSGNEQQDSTLQEGYVPEVMPGADGVLQHSLPIDVDTAPLIPMNQGSYCPASPSTPALPGAYGKPLQAVPNAAPVPAMPALPLPSVSHTAAGRATLRVPSEKANPSDRHSSVIGRARIDDCRTEQQQKDVTGRVVVQPASFSRPGPSPASSVYPRSPVETPRTTPSVSQVAERSPGQPAAADSEWKARNPARIRSGNQN